MMKRFPLFILATGCIMFLITSCNIKNGNTTNPQQGYFLVANISPDATPLNISINGSAFATNFAYGNYTPYYSTSAGSYVFSVYTSTSTSTPVLSSTINISPSTTNSYFLVDSFSKIKASLVQDNLLSTSSDSVYIRFFNFSPNVGTVYLRDSARKTDIYSGRTFNDQSSNPVYANFLRKLSGVYTLQIKLSDADSTIAASKTFTLSGGHTYTFFAKGILGTSDTTKALGIGQINNL